MLVAVLAAAVAMQQGRPEPLSVMSFNIRYGTAKDGEDRWELRKPRALEMIKRLRPRVLCLQEALDFQIDDITNGIGTYQAVGVGREDGKAKGEFAAILYDPARLRALRSDTFWLSQTPSQPNSMTWGNRVTRVCTWAYFLDHSNGSHFYVFNTHLDHESQPSRERAIALILERIAARGTNDPVILTGDLNVGEANPVVGQLREAGFVDSFRIAHPDEKVVGTFNAFKNWGQEKIDYIFVQAGTSVNRAEILREKIDGRWPSDHAPVYATLNLARG